METDQGKFDPPALSKAWTSTQRYNVATLCVHIVYERIWLNNDAELEWKQQFLTRVFQHLAVNLTKAQDENNNKSDIESLISTLKQPDIRQEIISEILLVCLGLMRNDIDSSSEGLDLKEKIDDVVSDASDVDIPLSDSIVLVNKPIEYDARSRAVLFKHAQYLDIPTTVVKSLEKKLAQHLYFLQQEQIETEKVSDNGDQNIQGFNNSASTSLISRDKKKRKWQWVATGVGAVVGATAIGLTGGLAAPFVAAGIGAITGAGIIATAATSVTLMTSLFGIAGGYKMHKRTQGLKEFSFTRIVQDDSLPLIPSLHVNIVISGYLLDNVNEFTTPWLPTFENLSDHSDTFALSFDPEILLSLGRSFHSFIAESAVKIAANEAIKRTIFAALASALMLPAALMKAGDLIDNPWALGVDRARKAGLVLADVLMERIQGKRPTVLFKMNGMFSATLECRQYLEGQLNLFKNKFAYLKIFMTSEEKSIGYSLGALVIWNCLQELKKRQQYGLIDSVVLIGAPISSKPISKWEGVSGVVSRRFVNAYATNDIVLGVIYRMHSLDLNVAGLSPVNCPNVENFDVTEYTSGHLGYREPETLTNILKKIQLD
ncbi:42459_t:CDS:2 [Gigaspora margarita]|uniref:42459_t:CDS:1 n=1 Tax=Gigaspora margarita TaxID=4874 RepID=A0ABN7VN06_GIGMA|nr:42459_t:CDS:2 [Gigaspora margarita]